jgi:2-polyprenyl-6-methoxyphenol hydroxylase-like FAD-dependent oxidoreductase
MTQQAKALPAFHLVMNAEAVDVIVEGDVVRGVRVNTAEGPTEIRADLVVGADGRHSTIRARAGLDVRAFGSPIDVLWFRCSRRPSDGGPTLGRIRAGQFLVTLDRGEYWQCALVIPKGGIDAVKADGLPALRNRIAAAAPFLTDRVDEIRTWDDVKLLTVVVDRLRRWHRPGLLCIGDAAHAMSPVGGVGINLAIQDAVATANMLAGPLRSRTLTERDLARVQARREWPARVTQAVQLVIQNRVLGRTIRGDAFQAPPWPFKLLQWFPALQRLPARFVGIGVRPEHVAPLRDRHR